MIEISAPFAVSVTVASNPAPPWLATAIANGYGPGQWARISGPNPTHGLSATNTIRQVTSGVSQTPSSSGTGLNGMLVNWSGGRKQRWRGTYGKYGAGPGGGHAGWGGNNSADFDMGTRLWEELHANQNIAGISYDTTFGEYSSDGSPGTVHTYFQHCDFEPIPGFEEGGLFQPATAVDVGNDGGNTIGYSHVQNYKTKAWSRGAIMPPGRFGEAFCSIWDSARARVIVWACTNSAWSDNILATFNPQTLAYTNIGASLPNGGPGDTTGNATEQCPVIDTVRDILILFNYKPSGSTKKVWYLKLGNLAEYRLANATPWRITELGTPPAKVEGAGVDWSELRSCVAYWAGNGDPQVYSFGYASGALGSQGVDGSLSYRWVPMLSPSNTVTPTPKSVNPLKIFNGVRNFLYGSGPNAIELAVTVPSVDGAVECFWIPNLTQVPQA